MVALSEWLVVLGLLALAVLVGVVWAEMDPDKELQ